MKKYKILIYIAIMVICMLTLPKFFLWIGLSKVTSYLISLFISLIIDIEIYNRNNNSPGNV